MNFLQYERIKNECILYVNSMAQRGESSFSGSNYADCINGMRRRGITNINLIRRDDYDEERRDWDIVAGYILPDGNDINVIIYFGYWVDERNIGSESENKRMADVLYDMVRRFQKEADDIGQYITQRSRLN